MVLGVAAAAALAVVLLASTMPARRAARIQPTDALRHG
jgi:ABC-type lipoprotein release transport system permease subunit